MEGTNEGFEIRGGEGARIVAFFELSIDIVEDEVRMIVSRVMIGWQEKGQEQV